MLHARAAGIALAALMLLVPAVHASENVAASDARYALVHGCYGLHSMGQDRFVAKAPGGGYEARADVIAAAEPFRMQATDLGSYLLYGKAQDYLAAGSGTATAVATSASPAADWKLAGSATGFTLTLADGRILAAEPGSGALRAAPAGTTGPRTLFTFVENQGCAVFPEAQTNATGSVTKGATEFGQTRGFMDSILHLMAFEFIGGSIRCARPWHPYGVTQALIDCPDHGPGGAGGALENALSYGGTKPFHDPVGWPTFKDWPNPETLLHEQVYYKWLERAYLGGQRLIVDVMVDNAQLCELYPLKRNTCDEMDNARLQIKDAYKLQDYVDAQSGGPGKGWFRIVTDPFEARRVINRGKLAVALGMETSRLFGCRLIDDKPACDRKQIDREFEDFYKRGVRSLQLVNKFDNALVGVTGDGGPTGLVINSGNRRETGHYWEFETCTSPTGQADDDEAGHDKDQTTSLPGGDEEAFARALQATAPPGFIGAGDLPVYPPAPHCNRRGLTDLGEYLIRKMVDRHMIVDPDHMSVKGRNDTLTILESKRYSGVLSTHGWSTTDSFPRIYALGGMVTPRSTGSEGFVKKWQRVRKLDGASGIYPFGLGIGSDISGLGSQGGPRKGNEKNPVVYPFRSLDPGITLNRSHSGQRTWDVNVDGVANYGLYPDWIEDLRKQAGDAIVEDLARGAETYIDMWERADGVPAERCQPARNRVTRAGLGRLHLGDDPEALLRRAGQPVRRPGRPWEYCVQGGRDGRPAGRIAPVFTQAGSLAFVGTTGPEHTVLGVATGDRAGKLPAGTGALRHGVRTRAAGAGRRYVFGIRHGRVSFVGVASKAASGRHLSSYLRLAELR